MKLIETELQLKDKVPMKNAITYFDKLCGQLTPALALVTTARRFGVDQESLRAAIIAQRVLEDSL